MHKIKTCFLFVCFTKYNLNNHTGKYYIYFLFVIHFDNLIVYTSLINNQTLFIYIMFTHLYTWN